MEMRPFGRLISWKSAQQRILDHLRPVQRAEWVSLAEGFDRVAAHTVRSPRRVPSFPRAAWDGYAFRATNTRSATRAHPVRLRIVGEVFAETPFRSTVGRGKAVAIATGGPLPQGTDAVLEFERTRAGRGWVEISQFVPAGNRVSQAGSDFQRGAPLAHAGEVLGPATVGALASVGCTRVRVFARPVVAILPNGNELVAPGRPLGPGQIFESNNATLGALVRAYGGVARVTAPLPDHLLAIERAIRAALRNSDLVLITGGSSVGERDFLPSIFPRLGRLLFHGIAVRPGKPTLAVAVGRKLVIGMPGHPTSCLANGYWLLLPVLRGLSRRQGPDWIDETVTLTEGSLAMTQGLATVVPFHVEDGRAVPTFRDSSAISSLEGVNAFAILPPGKGRFRPGERVVVHRLLSTVASYNRPRGKG